MSKQSGGGKKKSGKGSHGSLSKAGKTRALSPRSGQRKKHKCPKVGKRKRYNVWYNETYVLPQLIKAGIVKDPKGKERII